MMQKQEQLSQDKKLLEQTRKDHLEQQQTQQQNKLLKVQTMQRISQEAEALLSQKTQRLLKQKQEDIQTVEAYTQRLNREED